MSFPFNLYTNLITSPVPATAAVPDLVDPNTGVIQQVRYINPITQDYEISPTGHLYGMNSIQQQVTLSILTTFGSAVAPIGQTFLSTKTITSNIQNQMTTAVQSALANLINSGAITLNNVSIKVVSGGQVQIVVFFVDNQTGQSYQSNIPIQ
jgi:hypothetical protein